MCSFRSFYRISIYMCMRACHVNLTMLPSPTPKTVWFSLSCCFVLLIPLCLLGFLMSMPRNVHPPRTLTPTSESLKHLKHKKKHCGPLSCKIRQEKATGLFFVAGICMYLLSVSILDPLIMLRLL